MSSPSPQSPASPMSSGTAHSVIIVQQEPALITRRLSPNPSSKKTLRRQIYSVVRNLETVVSELNSVMHELQGVLTQIDKVTGCLDARFNGRMLYIQHNTESEVLWTTRGTRSISSGCSMSSRNSKPTSSTPSSSSSSSSSDVSSLWKLPDESHLRPPSIRKQYNNRRSRMESDTDRTRVRIRKSRQTTNIENKRRSKLLNCSLAVNGSTMNNESDEIRDKKQKTNAAFFRGFCCIRTQSMYSGESEPLRSCFSDDSIWVLRKGNGIKSPMSPFAPPLVPIGTHVRKPAKERSLSEGNVSSCSSSGRRRAHRKATVKLPEEHFKHVKRSSIRKSGIESLKSNGSIETDASSTLPQIHALDVSLPVNSAGLEVPLTTYIKSPVSSAQMHRDIFADTDKGHLIQGESKNLQSHNRKLPHGIYQYDSETETSQKEEDVKDGKEVSRTPESDASVSFSIGSALSDVEPNMVETDCEVEFSLMPTKATDRHGVSDSQDEPERIQRDASSVTLLQYDSDVPILRGSFASLSELEEFKRRYRIDSYDSDLSEDTHSEVSGVFSRSSKERELVAEGLKLILHDGNEFGNITEQKRKIMREIDNLKLSFSSALSTPESYDRQFGLANLPVDGTPNSDNILPDVFTLTSSSSNGSSPTSNEFHADPEVRAFLQELDKKVQERESKEGSLDNTSIFARSTDSLPVTDAILASKLTQALLDENCNITGTINPVFRSSMDSILSGVSDQHRSSDLGDSDHLMENFEWEHSFAFSMYQEAGAKIPDFSPDAPELTDRTLDSSFSQNFELDEAMTYSLSYPLAKAKSTSLSSESFVWSEGSISSDRRFDSTGKSIDELLSELDISADLLSKSELKRPDSLLPSIDKKPTDSLTRSEGGASEYKVGYNRDINTWTAFAMVHIGGSDSNLSRCSNSDIASHASTKSNNNLTRSPTDVKPAVAT